MVNIVKVNVDEQEKLADRFDVQGVPDVYYYKDGVQCDHQAGFGGKPLVMKTLSKLLYD